MTLTELREQVRGPVIEPGDDGYDEQRLVHNYMHDRRPAVIVRAVATADAVAAVNYARDQGLDLAVRGGGHSVPGFGTVDDGVVLDLSLMTNVFGPAAAPHAATSTTPPTPSGGAPPAGSSPLRASAA